MLTGNTVEPVTSSPADGPLLEEEGRRGCLFVPGRRHVAGVKAEPPYMSWLHLFTSDCVGTMADVNHMWWSQIGLWERRSAGEQGKDGRVLWGGSFPRKPPGGVAGEGGGWLLTCGNSPCYHNNEAFSRASDCHTQINIWLKTQHGHTKNQTKSWKPHLCWAAVFVTLWPEPSSPTLPHY